MTAQDNLAKIIDVVRRKFCCRSFHLGNVGQKELLIMSMVYMILHLVILVCMLLLGSRFVRAIEKIAENFEGPRPSA